MPIFDLDIGREVLASSQIAGIAQAELTIAEIGDHRAALFPGEASYANGVVERRAREFASGRHVARAALARIGVDPCEIPSDERRPVWPAAATASITHTRSLAAAIAGPSDTFKGLGIDIESATAVSQKIAERVLTDAERAWLPAPGWRSMVFAAKEAVYKAVNPVTGEFLGFREVELTIDAEDGAFRARCLQDRPSSPTVVAGRGYWALYRAHWLVVFVI